MKALILTDHSSHSSENSIYALTTELINHTAVEKVYVASRKSTQNNHFFQRNKTYEIWGKEIVSSFDYSEYDHPLESGLCILNISELDFIWLRLPPPLSAEFCQFIAEEFSDKVIVNNPLAIHETGSKEFLLKFQDVCAPMKICRSFEDIIECKLLYPVVLKPLREYGGKGILKIEGERVFMKDQVIHINEFQKIYAENPIEYLAVKFLKNVGQGDKRIVVIDGEIMGASLRLPPPDSWICNVSMGGSSRAAEVTEEEIHIIHRINAPLKSRGIIMYGADTLVGDDGKRVLSEINTTSIGGIAQIEQQKNLPVVRIGVDRIVKYVITHTLNRKE